MKKDADAELWETLRFSGQYVHCSLYLYIKGVCYAKSDNLKSWRLFKRNISSVILLALKVLELV